jgi:hypothetical protein
MSLHLSHTRLFLLHHRLHQTRHGIHCGHWYHMIFHVRQEYKLQQITIITQIIYTTNIAATTTPYLS